MSAKSKTERRKKRHFALRKRLRGTSERPRLVIFRSARHIYCQVIDDLAKKTIAHASDLSGVIKAGVAVDAKARKTERAKQVGVAIAKRCIEKGIQKVVFDRAGFKYHGRVSAVAAGAREGGLEF